MSEWTPITDDEAATLNAARDVLSDIRKRMMGPAVGLKPLRNWQAGFVCDLADEHLFQVLNFASVYGETLPENVLHNRKEKV